MNQQISQIEITINPEQFQQIIDAIHSGKYSLASVMILRFAGYNPLCHIPYRTYKRLIRENWAFLNQGMHHAKRSTEQGFE